MAAGAALGVGLMAGAASASPTHVSHITPVTATTFVINYQVPGGGGPWASDAVLRTATVRGGYFVAPWFCGVSSGPCFAYTATIWDKGMFRTFHHALAPNQSIHPGDHILSTVNGKVNGSASFGTFYATALPSAFFVPGFFNSGFGAAATWPELFFPHGTTFRGVNIGPFSVVYSAWTYCGPQRWTYASWNGLGNLPWDGNITGCFFFHHHWWPGP